MDTEWTLHIQLFGKFHVYRSRINKGREEQEDLDEKLDLDPQTQKLLVLLIAKCGMDEPRGWTGLREKILEKASPYVPGWWQGGRVALAEEWSEEKDQDRAIKMLNDYLSRLRRAFDNIASKRSLSPSEYQLLKQSEGSFLKLENIKEPRDAKWVRVSVNGKINGEELDQSWDGVHVSNGAVSQLFKLGNPTDTIHLNEVRLTWDHLLEGRLSNPDRNQLRFELNPPGRPKWHVDVIAFEEAAVEGLQRGDRDKLNKALKLYQGGFLGHFRDRDLEDWVIEKRDILLSLYLYVVKQAGVWSPIIPPYFGPYLLSHFLNRDDEIRRAYSALVHEEDSKIILIGGFGGIGKTSLGLMVCWHLMRELAFDKFIWISAQQRWIDEDTGEIIEESTNKNRGEQAHALSVTELWDEILNSAGVAPSSTSNKKEKVKEILRDKRWLIFVDNLETTANVEKILQDLQDVLLDSSSKALITSRQEPAKVRPDVLIPLRGLSREHILELVRYVFDDLGVDGGLPSGIEAIDEFAQCNPLIAKIIAAQLVRDGRVRAWEDVRKELEAAKAEVERLSEIEVRLKNGQVLKGTLVNQGVDTITVQVDSSRISIKRAEIQSVTTVQRGELFTYVYWTAWQKLRRLSRRVLIYIGKTAVAPVLKEELRVAFLPDPQLYYDEPKRLKADQEDLQEVLQEILGQKPNLDELEQALDKGLDEALQELGRHYLLEPSPDIRQEKKRYGVHPLTREFVHSELPKIWKLLDT